MNSMITSQPIRDIFINLIGQYQSTTPPSVSVDISGVDSTAPVSMIHNISYGFSTLDIPWICSAILLIVAFVCVIGLIKSVLTAIVR